MVRDAIYWILPLVLLWAGAGCSGKQRSETAAAQVGDSLSGTIQLSGAFALYSMAVKWSEEFRKLHPEVRIDISGGGAGKGMTDALAGVVDIGMVSRAVYPEELKRGAYPIAVVKDAVVMTVNARNPEIDRIRRVGLTREKADGLWSQAYTEWGQLFADTGRRIPIHVFTRSDACGAAETFAAWLGKRQEDLKATAVFGDPGVAAAIQKDRVAIGYNNLAYVYDLDTKRPFDGIAVVPLDRNGNGQIDPEEDFYGTTGELVRAIHEGRYPSPPARDLYFVTRGKSDRPLVQAFLRFVLTEGQRYAGETGYIALTEEQLKDERVKIE